jgi:hypothetical protein
VETVANICEFLEHLSEYQLLEEDHAVIEAVRMPKKRQALNFGTRWRQAVSFTLRSLYTCTH